MQNLAGVPNATQIIQSELTRCGINLCREPLPVGEPKSMLTGWLGDFTFSRAWYYWCVEGKVPLNMARAMYHNPMGKTDIRVSGDCGCPAPEGNHLNYFNKEGKQVFSLSTKADFEKWKDHKDSLGRISREWLAENICVEDPSAVAQAYVTSYHIDSEVGLFHFVQMMHKYEIAGPASPPVPEMNAENLCNRGACRSTGAICWNHTMQAYYCIPCARKINEHSKDLTSNVPMIRIPNKDTMVRLLKPHLVEVLN